MLAIVAGLFKIALNQDNCTGYAVMKQCIQENCASQFATCEKKAGCEDKLHSCCSKLGKTVNQVAWGSCLGLLNTAAINVATCAVNNKCNELARPCGEVKEECGRDQWCNAAEQECMLLCKDDAACLDSCGKVKASPLYEQVRKCSA
jgi:hypothetical protein